MTSETLAKWSSAVSGLVVQAASAKQQYRDAQSRYIEADERVSAIEEARTIAQ
jgi:hypothetical protein